MQCISELTAQNMAQVWINHDKPQSETMRHVPRLSVARRIACTPAIRSGYWQVALHRLHVGDHAVRDREDVQPADITRFRLPTVSPVASDPGAFATRSLASCI
jgi:hypothetical protein